MNIIIQKQKITNDYIYKYLRKVRYLNLDSFEFLKEEYEIGEKFYMINMIYSNIIKFFYFYIIINN